MVYLYSLTAMALAVGAIGFCWWRRIPMVAAILAANVIVFLLGLADDLGGLPEQFVLDLAARPGYVADLDWSHAHTLITATFLHQGPLHLVGNLVVLVLVGLPFEERVGRGRFLAIYFSSGVVAILLHTAWVATTIGERGMDDALVGASGCIFGILGAFAALYPRDEIPLFLVFFIIPRVPAFIAVAVMAALQGILLFFSGGGGVAYTAHIGGAVGGVIFGLLLAPRAGRKTIAATRIDYATLERLARHPAQRNYLDRVRENAEHRDVQRAWLERLLRSAQCPQCGSRYVSERQGTITCEKGHAERYLA